MNLTGPNKGKRLLPEKVEIREWQDLVYELSRFQNGLWVFRGVGAAAFFALADRDNEDYKLEDPLHDSDLLERESSSPIAGDRDSSPFEQGDCAVIYAWHAHNKLDLEETRCPFEGYDGVVLLNPPHIDQRIIAQDGVFSAFAEPRVPLNKDETRQILIEKKHKAIFLKRLFRMGIHHATLFPDLDGIAKHLSWRLRNYVGIGEQSV